MRGEQVWMSRFRPMGWGSSPHARGTVFGRGWERNEPGSSPHARGTGGGPPRHSHARGIIPACAGNRQRQEGRGFHNRDYPRMRGEQLRRDTFGNAYWGSSPRERGTGVDRGGRDGEGGIIPACAGNSLHRLPDRPGQRDHPRVRGEQSTATPRWTPTAGSSPRARGTDHEIHVR